MSRSKLSYLVTSLFLMMVITCLLTGATAWAQTWAITDTVKVWDQTGILCGLCSEQTGVAGAKKSYTLPPGPAVYLSSLVNLPSKNTRDAGTNNCHGTPGQWCIDQSKGYSASTLSGDLWTGHQNVSAASEGETRGTAAAKSTAIGVLTVKWGGNANGTAIPAGTKAKFVANGNMSVTCGTFTQAHAEMQIHIVLTAVLRGDGSAPPAVPPIDTTVAIDCPAPPVAGPFVLKQPFGNGLKVGDKYAFSIVWRDSADAQGFVNFSGNANAVSDFQNTSGFDAESALSPAVTFDFGPPLQVGVESRDFSQVRIQASPNPFKASVDLHFELDLPEHVRITIVDVQGRKVLDLLTADLPAGEHRVAWSGWDERHRVVAPGLYFARLETSDGHMWMQKLYKVR